MNGPAKASASLLLVFTMAAACHRNDPPATIGLANPAGVAFELDLVREDVAGWPGEWAQRIRFVRDTIYGFDSVDGEVSRAIRLSQLPGIVGVVGPVASRACLATAPIYNEAKIPQLLPGATSVLLRTAGPYTFMLDPDDSLQGAFIGHYISEDLGARTASVFYWNNEYGNGLRDGLRGELAQRGVRELDAVSFSRGPGFLDPIIASVRRQTPDVAVIVGLDPGTGPEGPSAEIAKTIHRIAPGVQLIGSDGLLSPLLASRVGSAAESLYVVAFWLPDSPDSVSRAFVARFRALAGRNPGHYEAYQYDALTLMATAVRAVGSNREAIRRYLVSLGKDRPLFHGVTGSISFGGVRTPRLVMARLQGGQLVSVPRP